MAKNTRNQSDRKFGVDFRSAKEKQAFVRQKKEYEELCGEKITGRELILRGLAMSLN